jgi:hypothetical protein
MKEIIMYSINWFPRIKKNKLINYKIKELEIFYTYPNFNLLNIVFSDGTDLKTQFREIL